MEIVYRKLDELIPNPKNPRKAPDGAIKKLAESIKANPKFFEARPILLSDRLGYLMIIGGERRSEAARLLGMTEVPSILIPGLSEEQEDEIMIRDNTHSGVWDDAKLQSWTKDQLQSWNVDGVKWPKEQLKTTEDDFEEKKIIQRCGLGDIWQLGNHRLMCGDTTKESNIQRLTGGGKIDLIITDPPYNVDYSAKNKFLNAFDKGNLIQKDIANDKMTRSKFGNFLKDAFDVCFSVANPGAAIYIFYASKEAVNFVTAFENAGFEYKQQLVWVKNNMVLGMQDYQWRHEPILYGWKPGKHYFIDDRSKFTTLFYDKPLKSDLHPTQKPIPMVAELINNSSMPGANVLDVFGGSGTTLIASEQTGRKCFIMELDPHYCDVIISRWEQFTGKKAIKL